MRRGVAAGLGYGLFAFLLGFVLGTVRVLVVAPSFGETSAVLIEIPLMLGAGWIASGWLMKRIGVPGRPGARTIMGLTAFTLLMMCEWVLGVTLFSRTDAEQFATMRTPAGSLGVAAQLLFAALPLVRLRYEKRGGRGRD